MRTPAVAVGLAVLAGCTRTAPPAETEKTRIAEKRAAGAVPLRGDRDLDGG